MSAIHAFATYETRYAPCGGITAVTRHLPIAIRNASGAPVVIITPYHWRVMQKNDVKTLIHSDFELEFGLDIQKIDVHTRTDDNITTYFLKPENPDYFAGFPHPYYPSYNLKRDSLLFGKMTAMFIPILNQEIGEGRSIDDWTLFLQEWEAATTVLAFADMPERPKMVLTMHNSYDSGGLPDAALTVAGIDPTNCPGPPGVQNATVMMRVLPLIQKPVLTVSRQFAADFFNARLQTDVLAPHLQNMLRNNLHGVDNGAFRDIMIDEDLRTSSVKNNLDKFQDWKRGKRIRAVEILGEHVKSENRTVWGDLQSLKTEDEPWFIMAGRDDPRQKGYDVAVSAITSFLHKGGDAHFFFFPILGDEGVDGLTFLKDLCDAYPEKVTAFPIRFDAGYFPTLEASTFGMMPSLYEPFGMANEFYYYGTVAIGRATGGMIQQIVPLRSVKSFTPAVSRFAAKWHDPKRPPTGILFREEDDIDSRTADWHKINGARYQTGGEHPNRIELRSSCSLFRSMAEALETAINDGVDVFHNQPELYCQMLLDGVEHIKTKFTWQKAAQEYLKIAANLK